MLRILSMGKLAIPASLHTTIARRLDREVWRVRRKLEPLGNVATQKGDTCMRQSEVAQLLQQIDLEYGAAREALTGLALGTTKHEFITARMERLTLCHEQLSQHVGIQEASRLLVERMEAID